MDAAARVTLCIPAALRMHCAGADQLSLDATSVRAALAAAGARHASLSQYILTRDGQLRPFVKVFVHNQDVRDLDGLDTRLVDGDEVLIVPSVAGG
ncbi:MAG TPA: MoaD/ThiS family protein [Rhodanobacteraceae bacterium]|jgi:adenylyltransferase/sulfurtransferase|nr:MoaD/ThiS family protein [Rhodanobacteraceae bacterium]